jgi:nitrous oxide reductase accessory protein NosL
MKGTEELACDRCSPGTLSFRNKPDADAFTAKNGGSVLSFSQLMSEARFQ